MKTSPSRSWVPTFAVAAGLALVGVLSASVATPTLWAASADVATDHADGPSKPDKPAPDGECVCEK